MKITMYTLHGMWHSNYEDQSVVVGISTDEAGLIKELGKIADNKARDYLEMCGYIQEKRDEKNYEATNGCGKHIEFHITEHQVDLPEEVMGSVGREMEKINRTSDVEAYLETLLELESIAPWKYEYMMRKSEVMQEILAMFDEKESCNTPYNNTMEYVVETVMNELVLLDDQKLEFLWEEFREDVMIDEDGHILCDFVGFESGTDEKEVYRWFDKWYSGGIAKLIYPDMEPLNTRITYLYRDSYNYKRVNQVVISGVFTMEQIDTIMDCLEDGWHFIPEQVGFPAVRTGNPAEDGWMMELNRDRFMPDSGKPDIDMTPDEVVAKFLEAKGKWDESKAQ